MGFLMRLMIGLLKVAATVWVFVTVRRYFGTMAVMAEIARRAAGLFGFSRAFSLLTAINSLRARRPVPTPVRPQTPGPSPS